MRATTNCEELRQRINELEDEVVQLNQKNKELDLFKTIAEKSSEAIAISDPTGKIIYINHAHEKLFGRSLDALENMNYRDFYPMDSIEVLNREIAPALERGESWEGILDSYNANGIRFPLWERADTVRDAEDNMVYGFGIMHDATKEVEAEKVLKKSHDEMEKQVIEHFSELKRTNEKLGIEIEKHKLTESALRLSEERHKKAEKIAEIGHWSWDIASDKVEWSEQVYEIFNAYRKEPSYEYAKSFVHSDDLDLWQNTVEKAVENKVPFTLDYRVIRPDGKTIWVHNETETEFNETGEFKGYRGTVQDITKRKQTEEALQKREKEMEIQSLHLQEVNLALKVLLKQREENKKELQASIVANVEEFVFPYLKKLSEVKLDDRHRAYIKIIQSNLNDIISPFIGVLSSRLIKLTPTQVQVANFIKHGKTTKEIAEMLNLSVETIKFHRKNIREKIGIKNKKANLRTYLLSVQ